MVSKLEVELAYRLILGREPENQEVVKMHADGHNTLNELRQRFLDSKEFEIQYFEKRDHLPHNPAALRAIDWPAGAIETEIDDAKLQLLVARVERAFTHFGNTEPHWSVLSHEKFRTINIREHEDEFFASGKSAVNELKSAARRYGLAIPDPGDCFELGCGLGRTTIWLAEAFGKVLAADVSTAHLELARLAAKHYGKDNIEFLHLNSVNAFNELPFYDVFVSIIVLQHNPPPLLDYLLRCTLRRLRKNGLGYFQIPTSGLHYRFAVDEYLSVEQSPTVPEMHVLPQRQLFRLIEQENCELIEVREDDAAGAKFVSNRVLVRKK